MLFVALHAPHRAHEREMISSWWQCTASLVQQYRRNDPVILAGDMNASVGSVPSDSVSTCCPEIEDVAGECLHSILRSCECWLPCTFSESQIGPSATFTQKRNGKPCRPDFIAIPLSWGIGQVQAWVEPGVHVATAGLDHVATCVEVKMRMATPGATRIRPRAKVRRELFTDPQYRAEVMQALQATPRVEWGVSAHAHAALVVDHLQQALTKIDVAGRVRPTHVYLQEQTWQLQRRVTRLKRSLRNLQQQIQQTLLAFCFDVWAGPRSAYDDQVTPWSGGWANRALVSSVLHLYHIRADSKRLRQACKRDRDVYVSGLADDLATCPNNEVFATLHKLLCHKRKKAYAPEPLPQVRDSQGEICLDAESARIRWREYFSAMEAGSSMSFEALAEHILKDQPNSWPAPQDLKGIPGLPDLTRVLLATKSGKAAGMDGLPGEMLRHFAPECAQIIFPLLLNLVFRGVEALGMKGGMAVWFHKGKGAKDVCEAYRQILLLPCFAKAIHQAVRPAIRELFLEQTPSLQIGGKPGQSVCFGAHLVRTFLRYNARLKRGCFVLFTDIASAFYAVIRQLVAEPCAEPEGARGISDDFFRGLGMSDEDVEQLRAHLAQPTSLQLVGASPWLEAVADRVSGNTWFLPRDDHTAVLTARGTRPGSSWADILFGFVIARVLAERDVLESGDQAPEAQLFLGRTLCCSTPMSGRCGLN